MLPEGWRKIQIKDCGKVVTGTTPSTNDSSYYGEDFIFISPSDMNVNKVVISSEKNYL